MSRINLLPRRSYKRAIIQVSACALALTLCSAGSKRIANRIEAHHKPTPKPVSVTPSKIWVLAPPPTRWEVLAAALETPLKNLPDSPKALPLPEGVEIVLKSDPFFLPGTASTREENEGPLQELATWLAGNPEMLSISIEGHTDDTPVIRHRREFASNWQLSAARAGALAMLFERSSFPADRLRATGRGASGSRRIVIRLSSAQGGT